MARLTLVVAATSTHGIGRRGGLPWRLPKEMAYFARITNAAPEGSTNAVLMGRNTWESIPLKFRPLPGRVNVVMTRSADYRLGTDSVGDAAAQPDFTASLAFLDAHSTRIHRHFVIGGASLYSEALALPATAHAHVNRVLLTRVLAPAFEDCDVFVPELAGMVDGHAQGYGVDSDPVWRRASHVELCEWAGFDVPGGVQEEKGVRYEFQMWVRR